MLAKGKAASAFSRRPDPDIWAVLTFGEDEGLGADAARAVLSAWAGKGPLEITTLDEDAVRKDPGLLFDTLEAVSLLAEPRAVRVRLSSEKSAAPLIEVITAAERTPDRFAARLIIEAGSLAAKSKLRATAEAAKRTMALHFYTEAASDVRARAEAALLDMGAAIEPDALDLFVGDLPGHRALANSEIEKLCLYARGLGRAVNRADIRALSATDLEQDLSAAIRAALSGDAARAHAWLDRAEAGGTQAISVLRSLQYEVLRLIDAGTRLAAGDDNPGQKLRPPIWQSDWPAYRALVQKWPPRRLMRVLERIYDAEAQAKTAGATSGPAVRILINDLARVAAPSPAQR